MPAVFMQQNISHFERFDSLNSLKGSVTSPSWSPALDNYLEKPFGFGGSGQEVGEHFGWRHKADQPRPPLWSNNAVPPLEKCLIF